MIGKNFVKSKLENKEVCLGIWSIINANINLDIFSKCGIMIFFISAQYFSEVLRYPTKGLEKH